MSFPTIAAVASTQTGGSNVSSFDVNLPSGVVSGSLLVIHVSKRLSDLVSWPAGWNIIAEATSSTTICLSVAYRIADGSEGATINLTAPVAARWAARALRIEGYTGVPEATDVGSGNGANANPPSLTPSWGIQDALWLAMASWDGNPSVSAAPANYTGLSTVAPPFVTEAYATRELNAGSEDPGAFTSGSEQWAAATVAIQGSGGGVVLPTPSLLSLGVGA